METLNSIIENGKQMAIEVGKLKPSPYNTYEICEVDDLKGSILTYGVITPLAVVGPEEDGTYTILCGERRYTAVKALVEEGYENLSMVPCYLIGDADMDITEQKLIIEASNIDIRSNVNKEAHRFEIIRLLKELEEKGSIRGEEIVKEAKRYMKVSERYSRIYYQVFRDGAEPLKDYLTSGNIRTNDAGHIASLPEEKQIEAVERLKENDEKKKLASTPDERKTVKQERREILDNYRNKKENKKEAKKIAVDMEELNNDSLDFMDEFDDFDLTSDSTGLTGIMLDDNKEKNAEKYQEKLDMISDWCESILKKDDLKPEEYAVLESMQKVIEKFAYSSAA